MHHLYPLAKGDQLCPLGFHPQVRWPTRCKRCFRDYKEHGGKRGGEDIAISSPSLSESPTTKTPGRTWTSTQNLSTLSDNGNGNNGIELRKRPSSWTSTPDLDDVEKVTSKEQFPDVSVSVSLPQRRHTTTLDVKELEETFTIRKPPKSPSTPTKDGANEDLIILKTDSLAERVRKMNLLKKQNSTERESSRERSIPRKTEKEESPIVEKPRRRSTETEKKKVGTTTKKTTNVRKPDDTIKTKQDVEFLIQIKESASKKQDDNESITTETTETTLVGSNDKDLQEEIKYLQKEVDLLKTRAERAERDKSDMLLRRLAAIDTGPNRTAASEALKLQQKVNELKTQVEDLRDDKKCLSIRVKELEQDLNARPAKSVEEELRRKLQAAEQLCEELMDENEDIKKELRGMEQEIDEMHDNFREDQVEEFTSVRKELEQTMKNCRILSFKLKKSERKIEQLESEKQTLGSQNNSDLIIKVKRLEDDLKLANELARRLQAEVDQSKGSGKKKPPTLGIIGKSTSADGKYSRESLTRGGSQEDPEQLMRDLRDAMEREADLKEQLKFAEEEAESLRKKASRVEDENESLMMQLKKMASRARSRKLSPNARLTPEPPVERDEGISDDDDPAELRVLLELNEQEASVLRQKVEDLETESVENKKHIRELQEKLRSSGNKKLPSLLSKNSTLASDKMIKSLEDEMCELRKSIVEKDRSIDRLKAELAASKNISGKTMARSGSLEDKLDLKRQLEMVEQEATVLRSKITTLEQENEKLTMDNKKLQMQSGRKSSTSNEKTSADLLKLKETLSKVEKDRDELSSKMKIILQEADEKLPARTPKKPTDLTPKTHLKKWVEDLEDEIKEMRAVIVNSGAERVQKLESAKSSVEKELKEVKDQLNSANQELKKLKTNKENSQIQSTKLTELENKFKKSEDENNKLNSKIKDLEDKIKKQDTQIRQLETAKVSLESQVKKEKDKFLSIEKDYEKEKKERQRWENKVTEIDDELNTVRRNAEKRKSSLEKEIQELKAKEGTKSNSVNNKQLQDLKKQNEDLQANLSKESKRYSDLNGRYESLSEEHVFIKAQLATEKQNLLTEQNSGKQRQSELNNLKTEKSELTKKLKDAEKKISELESRNIKTGAMQYEKNMLKTSLGEKEREFERLKKENNMNIDIVMQVRKENDELRKKIDDYQRLDKAQRSMHEHSSNLENELKKMRVKYENAELTAKSEVASTRLRYEQQVKNLSAELNSMQRQCERFKKDRDSFKQMLESAQKKIGELKSSGRQSRSSGNSGDEDDKTKIINLEQQIGCLEDQICESRLEVSKLKTELVSERSANEIKISEMTSKLNEYEEDRLMGSGRTKIPGMKTKLELSWQKEREEQQRLLQETSTLARDLRQTLFEVERERDKERLESKRKLDQLKRATEEELDEGRKKISELQYDLLELRDVHAKLRTSNEKLRRERERYEREMVKRRLEQDGERRVGALLQTVDELVKIAPELQMTTNSVDKKTLKPEPVRTSRSSSPNGNSMQISSVLARLAEASEELRRYQRMYEEDGDRVRLRRSGMRRAASTENENPGLSTPSTTRSAKLSRSNVHNGSLYRKSLSLDQSIQQDQSIWRQDDGSMSSIQSIDSELGGLVRDSSMDSRLSGGSTQSDIPRGPRKKKKGLMGKLRSLTKSKGAESEGSVQGSDSDVSMSSDVRSSKKDLRGRLSGMFKRSGSTSRSASAERGTSDSQQRPVAVTIVGGDDQPPRRLPPTPVTPKTIRNPTPQTKLPK